MNYLEEYRRYMDNNNKRTVGLIDQIINIIKTSKNERFIHVDQLPRQTLTYNTKDECIRNYEEYREEFDKFLGEQGLVAKQCNLFSKELLFYIKLAETYKTIN